MRDASGHGADSLHFLRFAQLGFKLVAVRLGLLAAGEVAGKNGGGFTLGMALERHAHFHRQLLAAGGKRRHFAQQRLGGELRKRQRLRGIGKKTLQRAAQRVAGTALEQRRGRGVEDRDVLVLVYADDGIQGGVDDGLQPFFAGVQLLVALLQGLALGQQRALVDHGAQKLEHRRGAILGHLDAGNVQVARDAPGVANHENHFGGFAVALRARHAEGLLHAVGVVLADKRHQRRQWAVLLGGLERALRHRVGLHHHVVLVHHHQGQWHAGK